MASRFEKPPTPSGWAGCRGSQWPTSIVVKVGALEDLLYKATRCACAAHWEGGVRPRTANAIAIMDLDNIISPSFFPTGSSCKAWNRGRSDGYWRLQTATAVEESPSAMISAQPGHDSFRGVRWLQGWWAGSESGTGGRDQTA